MTEKFLRTPEDVARINNTLQLSSVNSSDYSAVIFPGGNGATYDFPWDDDVNRIASEIYEHGGIVGSSLSWSSCTAKCYALGWYSSCKRHECYRFFE